MDSFAIGRFCFSFDRWRFVLFYHFWTEWKGKVTSMNEFLPFFFSLSFETPKSIKEGMFGSTDLNASGPTLMSFGSLCCTVKYWKVILNSLYCWFYAFFLVSEWVCKSSGTVWGSTCLKPRGCFFFLFFFIFKSSFKKKIILILVNGLLRFYLYALFTFKWSWEWNSTWLHDRV